MVEVHNETLMRITAQFVAEQEAGQQPRLGDYIRRYPGYADEIVDFIAYYYALEVNLPTATEAVPQLSASSRAALERIWQETERLSAGNVGSLLALAEGQRYTLTQLAVELDLGADVVEQLAQGQFDPATVPRELLQRLAHVLAQSISVVRRVLGMLEPPTTHALAEERVLYTLPPRQSFRQAVLASAQLSLAQKEQWQSILESEGL